MTIISLPMEAQHTRKHYAKKVKSRAYYASANQASPINEVNYTRYSHRRNTVKRYSRPIVTRPVVSPVIQTVRTIPRDAIRFRGQHQDFYYSCGNFYQATRFGFRTTVTPLGAEIRELPRRARSVYYRGNALYQLDYLLLEAVVNKRGRVIYQVVGQV